MLYCVFKLFMIAYFMTVCVHAATTNRNPRKRQIYREQVLPHAGGRIPDTAFETDRLFLNQLQKDGFAVPDGILPEQRNPQVYPFFNRPSRKVYRIALSSDGRYTPQEGRYQYQELPSIETTYLYPQIHGQTSNSSPQSAVLPIYRPFRIHNPLLNQIEFQPKDKTQFQNVFQNVPASQSKVSTKAKSYQNLNILNIPLTPLAGKSSNGGKHYIPDSSYASQSHLFNDFDDLFNKFDIYDDDINKSNGYVTSNLNGQRHQHHIVSY